MNSPNNIWSNCLSQLATQRKPSGEGIRPPITQHYSREIFLRNCSLEPLQNTIPQKCFEVSNNIHWMVLDMKRIDCAGVCLCICNFWFWLPQKSLWIPAVLVCSSLAIVRGKGPHGSFCSLKYLFSRKNLQGTYSRDFPEELQGPSQPDLPLWHRPSARTWFGPDFDLILTWNPPFQVRIRSKSGRNQVQVRSGRRGRCQRGRSGSEGPCSSSGKSLTYSAVLIANSSSTDVPWQMMIAQMIPGEFCLSFVLSF